MLPDGPPPVPKHKYFKKLIKPKITFRFLLSLYLQHQPTCCSAIFFWLLKVLNQITTSINIDILHFIKLKNTAITEQKLVEKDNTFQAPISILEKIIQRKVRIADADLRLKQ
jgi:hypothetical protein